ncbi:L,D-transpeptidase [Streptomyces sp. RB6PN25]|uniref:L,D-transpeptidase n=1 Tax=Streptomyces humicola TaxID=2953240 RepID=A0ABT1Q334_9ACTN|nr:L,D-transpeptidase [Streptomyces humicola]MCQ4083740.1 L,D-transpeptidase [Streptomyces humicola]
MARQRRRTIGRTAIGAALVTVLASSATATAATTYRSDPVTTGHVTTIDATTHTMRVTDNGRTVMTFPVGFGKPGFRTPSGTFHVLGKDAVIEMTSCSAHITCDRSSPSYYDLTVHWAVRLTSGGVFVHAAPWDSQIGTADTSHGCIHLSTADARRFYAFTRLGDTVIVQGTGRTSVGPAGP